MIMMMIMIVMMIMIMMIVIMMMIVMMIAAPLDLVTAMVVFLWCGIEEIVKDSTGLRCSDI